MQHNWDAIAAIRKHQIESGLDLTFSKVFLPYYHQLVQKLAPSSILEVGGGTGHLALSLANISQRYVMLEPSRGMYDVASDVLAGTHVEARFCTAEDLAEGEQFDLVLSHMCLQAVSDIDEFLTALAKAISPTGTFLLSLPHPVFYNEYKGFFPPTQFRYMGEQSGIVSFSITLDPGQNIGGIPYYHRPLSSYVSALAGAGLALTYMEETYPSKDIQELYGQPWGDPRYLVLGGCKLPGKATYASGASPENLAKQ